MASINVEFDKAYQCCAVCRVYAHEYALEHATNLCPKRCDYSGDTVSYNVGLETFIKRGVRMYAAAEDPSLAALYRECRSTFEVSLAAFTRSVVGDFSKRQLLFEKACSYSFGIFDYMTLKDLVTGLYTINETVVDTMLYHHVQDILEVPTLIGVIDHYGISNVCGLIKRTVRAPQGSYLLDGYRVTIVEVGACGAAYFITREHHCVLSNGRFSTRGNVIVATHESRELYKLRSRVVGNRFFPLDVYVQGSFLMDESVYDEAFEYISTLQCHAGTTSVVSVAIKELICESYNVPNVLVEKIARFVFDVHMAKVAFVVTDIDIIEKYENILDDVLVFINSVEFTDDDVDDDVQFVMKVLASNYCSFTTTEEKLFLNAIVDNVDMMVYSLLLKFSRNLDSRYSIREMVKFNDDDDINYWFKLLLVLGYHSGVTLLEEGVLNPIFARLAAHVTDDLVRFWHLMDSMAGQMIDTVNDFPLPYRYLLMIQNDKRMLVLCKMKFQPLIYNSLFDKEFANRLFQFVTDYKDYMLPNAAVISSKIYRIDAGNFVLFARMWDKICYELQPVRSHIKVPDRYDAKRLVFEGNLTIRPTMVHVTT